MKRIIGLVLLLTLAGCAKGYDLMIPKFMGPAENVDCNIHRENGDPIGTIKCTFDSKYLMEDFGIF